MTNWEKKVKNLYPNAEPYMGVMGWGIRALGYILAVARFQLVSTAWRHAWRSVSAETNKQAVKP